MAPEPKAFGLPAPLAAAAALERGVASCGEGRAPRYLRVRVAEYRPLRHGDAFGDDAAHGAAGTLDLDLVGLFAAVAGSTGAEVGDAAWVGGLRLALAATVGGRSSAGEVALGPLLEHWLGHRWGAVRRTAKLLPRSGAWSDDGRVRYKEAAGAVTFTLAFVGDLEAVPRAAVPPQRRARLKLKIGPGAGSCACRSRRRGDPRPAAAHRPRRGGQRGPRSDAAARWNVPDSPRATPYRETQSSDPSRRRGDLTSTPARGVLYVSLVGLRDGAGAAVPVPARWGLLASVTCPNPRAPRPSFVRGEALALPYEWAPEGATLCATLPGLLLALGRAAPGDPRVGSDATTLGARRALAVDALLQLPRGEAVYWVPLARGHDELCQNPSVGVRVVAERALSAREMGTARRAHDAVTAAPKRAPAPFAGWVHASDYRVVPSSNARTAAR
ncbi:hypothetical protein JL722_11713 [Aureococcus anophagefferens]|nr:hypothetical protein JL722_11713 [Aureococcus anophagefferens]